MRVDIWCIFVFVSLICFSGAVNGVVPAKYDVDFSPNLRETFSFTFVNDDGTCELYLEGELAEYFEIKTDKYFGNQRIVVVDMMLPSAIQRAGSNRIYVGCKELGSLEGVSITMNVRGVIDIYVPYPNKYADVEFSANYVNQGEKAKYKLLVHNRGEDNIYVSPKIQLRTGDRLIDSISLEGRAIDSMKTSEFIGEIDTDDYVAGDYNLTAVVEYGGELPRSETVVFRVGELHMEITNYTMEYVRGGINRINVIVESFWNNNISNVYVNGSIVGYPQIRFESASYSVEAWESKVFQSFFDTSEIRESKFQISINVNYGGKMTNKIVDVYFRETVNWTLIIIISVVCLIIVLFFVIFILMRKKKNG